MMHPSTMKLVDRLCAMTAQGKIEWTHGEAAESLVYDTEGYSVVLQGEPTNILLTDSSGVELEKVSAADLAQTSHADRGTYDVAVAALLVDAQRVARGTETAINTVLQGLDLDGDGVVDMPMEAGLVPTAAEIADHEPDMGEDTADESGVASLADADVTDVSNAVASLADEVNQTEQIASNEANDLSETVEETVYAEPEIAPEPEPTPEDDTSSVTTHVAGLGMAGLGAAGLLKAARQTTESEQKPEQVSSETFETHIEPAILEAVAEVDLPEPVQSDIADTTAPMQTSFNLSSAELSDAPLQLAPEPSQSDAAQTDGEKEETNEFIPPRPGQFLSLSGLTNGTTNDTPVMAGTATSMTHMASPPHSEPAIPTTPQAEQVDTVPPAPEAPQPPAAEDADRSEIAATPAETPNAPPPEPEQKPEPAEETPRPSRFNPWI